MNLVEQSCRQCLFNLCPLLREMSHISQLEQFTELVAFESFIHFFHFLQSGCFHALA